MERRDVVEAIMYNDKNEILLQKKTLDYPTYYGGYWMFFGGEVEKGEEVKETLKREIEEETGIKIKDEDIELVYEEDYMIGSKFKGKQYSYKIKFKGELSDIKLTEGAGFAFFDKSELDELKIPEIERQALKAFWKSFEN